MASLVERLGLAPDVLAGSTAIVTGAGGGIGLERLASIEAALRGGANPPSVPVESLAGYYDHLAQLAQGWGKDPAKLEESLRHVHAWRDEARELARLLGGSSG